MEQLPDDRLQVVEENVILPETFDQVTVPVIDESAPDTAAVHVTGTPVLNVDSVHDSVRTVAAFVIVSPAARELP
jgi:hypothetical protein